jgi:hypothetical protein
VQVDAAENAADVFGRGVLALLPFGLELQLLLVCLRKARWVKVVVWQLVGTHLEHAVVSPEPVRAALEEEIAFKSVDLRLEYFPEFGLLLRGFVDRVVNKRQGLKW